MNPDGLMDGWSHNGPGRCAVGSSVDMNRCFPTNFVTQHNGRNYTGSKPLIPIEAEALSKKIIELKDTKPNRMVVLDCHGWMNETIGDEHLGRYFCKEFGFRHRTTWGQGYFSAWAKEVCDEALLVEYPITRSLEDVYNKGLHTKTINAIKNIINTENISTEIPEKIINKKGRVINITSVLNVRADAGTNFSILGNLANGENVNISTQKGDWYKIKNDSIEGYVYKEYIEVLEQNEESEVLMKERIVVSASEYTFGRWKYNFIATAIKQLREYKSSYPNDKITWLISARGYSDLDIKNFMNSASKMNVHLRFFWNIEDLINYINGNRKYKIANFTVFSHGVVKKVSLGYKQLFHENELEFEIDDIKNIDKINFDKNSFSHFYSCNTATIEKDTSFALEWFKHGLGKIKAAVNKTNYGEILGKTEEEIKSQTETAKGYNDNGSIAYPTLGKDAKWIYLN